MFAYISIISGLYSFAKIDLSSWQSDIRWLVVQASSEILHSFRGLHNGCKSSTCGLSCPPAVPQGLLILRTPSVYSPCMISKWYRGPILTRNPTYLILSKGSVWDNPPPLFFDVWEKKRTKELIFDDLYHNYTWFMFGCV